jgi:hypothetical protein
MEEAAFPRQKSFTYTLDMSVGADGVVKRNISVINVVFTLVILKTKILDVTPFNLENSVPTFRRHLLLPFSV